MLGLVPGIHVLLRLVRKDVDGRDKPGHDEHSEKAQFCRLQDEVIMLVMTQ
jgi:hypothetical protein